MTGEEAGKVLGLLTDAYSDHALEPSSAELYVQELALLHHWPTAMVAAREWVRQQDKFPTIHQFRSVYRSIHERLEAEERARVRAIEAPHEVYGPPEWVQVWWWGRHARVPRVVRTYPQQLVVFQADGPYAHEEPTDVPLTDNEYKQLHTEWVLAGRPGVSTSAAMAAAMAGAVKNAAA